jgi:sporulation integral membrane protein YtvI
MSQRKEDNILNNFPRDKLINWTLFAATALFAVGALYILIAFFLPEMRGFFNGLVFVVAPFVIAWLASIFARPLVDFCHIKLHIPRGLAALIVLLVLLFLVFGILSMIISRIVVDIISKTTTVEAKEAMDSFFVFIQDLLLKVDFHVEDLSALRDWLISQSEKIINIASSAAKGGINIIQATPSVLLFIVVTLVAMYFWFKDSERIENVIVHLAPKKSRSRFKEIFKTLSVIVGEYCRAQMILIVISMCICVIAFSIMGINGAFSYGLLTGFLDILPVLGPGTIIIPWGVIALVSGNHFIGFGMLILYVVLIVTRNVIEPKLVGDRLGLHPLATLAAIFVGFHMMGIWGLFVGPIALAIGYAIWKSSKIVT